MLALETTHPELPKVLVAEDNNVLGDVIRFNLLRAGCDVTLVRNGKEAREQIETNNVTKHIVVFCDEYFRQFWMSRFRSKHVHLDP